ncbi:MAG: phosphonate C-P lyase system protein PhnH [Alphaproteobacteria bacterium]
MTAAAPLPGFADPVQDSQRAFRAMLDAIAHPGRIVRIEAPPPAPAPMMPAAAAALLTLVDHETPLWLDPAARTPEALAWVRFHCGAPVVDAPEACRFALVTDPAAMPALDRFPVGADAFPDRSATLILQVAGLAEGAGMVLRGPGIETVARLAVEGLPAAFADAWRANRALFPCGVDLFLVAGERVAALPRTTELEG